MGWILAIETSTMLGSVALTEGDRCLHEIAWEGKEGHARQLMPAIQTLLTQVSDTYQNDKCPTLPTGINAIAIAIGPGSFTGLRVGLATAKGLAVGWERSLVAVSSLAAMTLHAAEREGLIVPMFDARRGEIYTAAFRTNGSAVLPEQVVVAGQWAGQLRAISEPCICLGDGYLKYESVFKEVLGARCPVPGTDCHAPSAAFVGRLAAAKLARGDVADVATIVPNYLRRPQAEEKQITKHHIPITK